VIYFVLACFVTGYGFDFVNDEEFLQEDVKVDFSVKNIQSDSLIDTEETEFLVANLSWREIFLGLSYSLYFVQALTILSMMILAVGLLWQFFKFCIKPKNVSVKYKRELLV
jgi:hypothetical protein